MAEYRGRSIFGNGSKRDLQKPSEVALPQVLEHEPFHEPDYSQGDSTETAVHRMYGQKRSPQPDSEDHLTLLAEAITKMPLNDIANDILKLTYGEMVQLCEEMWSVAGSKPFNKDTLPKVIHAWALFKKTGEKPEVPITNGPDIKKEPFPKIIRAQKGGVDSDKDAEQTED